MNKKTRKRICTRYFSKEALLIYGIIVIVFILWTVPEKDHEVFSSVMKITLSIITLFLSAYIYTSQRDNAEQQTRIAISDKLVECDTLIRVIKNVFNSSIGGLKGSISSHIVKNWILSFNINRSSQTSILRYTLEQQLETLYRVQYLIKLTDEELIALLNFRSIYQNTMESLFSSMNKRSSCNLSFDQIKIFSDENPDPHFRSLLEKIKHILALDAVKN